MTGVIQFALGGSVELESQSRRGFPTRAEWLFLWCRQRLRTGSRGLRIELHFRAAAACHAKAQMMAASPPGFLCRLSPRVAMVEATQAWQ